jgi:tRNA1Val (adenine37-N6)-methyltransferase
MSNNYFQFKQFTIQQDRCAMKVGTDGVLLGAWVDHKNANNILDIGTGTGLIALMLAQRSSALIDAVEIDPVAAEQALSNVKNSPWENRISVFPSSIQEYTLNSANRYDLIVTNPPYFINSLPAPDQQRNQARHGFSLSIPEIIACVSKLLTPDGKLAIILPVDIYPYLTETSYAFKLFPIKETAIIPSPGKKAIRKLAEFARTQSKKITSELVIEQSVRHKYSEEYINLTRDFYFNF